MIAVATIVLFMHACCLQYIDFHPFRFSREASIHPRSCQRPLIASDSGARPSSPSLRACAVLQLHVAVCPARRATQRLIRAQMADSPIDDRRSVSPAANGKRSVTRSPRDDRSPRVDRSSRSPPPRSPSPRDKSRSPRDRSRSRASRSPVRERRRSSTPPRCWPATRLSQVETVPASSRRMQVSDLCEPAQRPVGGYSDRMGFGVCCWLPHLLRLPTDLTDLNLAWNECGGCCPVMEARNLR